MYKQTIKHDILKFYQKKNSGGSISTRASIPQFSLYKLVNVYTVVQVSLSNAYLGEDYFRSRKERMESIAIDRCLVCLGAFKNKGLEYFLKSSKAFPLYFNNPQICRGMFSSLHPLFLSTPSKV
jgi:hypothetical protein